MAKIDLHDDDVDIKIHCLKCQTSFHPSHSCDILDESHQHFQSTRHTNSTKPKMKTKHWNPSSRNLQLLKFHQSKHSRKKNGMGFGIKIELNFQTGFSGKHYSVGKKYGVKSAWAVGCGL